MSNGSPDEGGREIAPPPGSVPTTGIVTFIDPRTADVD